MILNSMIKTNNKRQRVVEIGVALALFLVFVLAYPAFTNFRRARVPVSAWFEVAPVVVTDTYVGDDPLVWYERSIKKEFFGDWAVEIKDAHSDGVTACYGNGAALYTPNRDVINNPVSLSWFIGKFCDLPAGAYHGTVTFVLKKEGFFNKFLIVDILPFSMLERNE